MEIISPNYIVEEMLKKNNIIYQDEVLKISYINNSSQETVIIFSHAVSLPKDSREMFGGYTYEDRNVIHIVDVKCSWFNNFTPEFVLSKIQDLVDNKKIYLVGASMGGFNAIIFSNYINNELCIAFGPQYSIIEDICPYSELTGPRIKDIKNIKIDTLNFSNNSKYIILFGDDEEEKNSYIPTLKKCKDNNINLKYAILKDASHEVLPYLVKKYDSASTIIKNLIEKDFKCIIKTYDKSKIIF
jgi:hypothetical protein